MAKKRILKKQKQLSGLKGSKKMIYDWNPTSELLDEKALALALFDCLKEEDTESFKEILLAHINAKVKTRVAQENGLPLRTLFAALSSQGNPSLSTLAKLVKLACAS